MTFAPCFLWIFTFAPYVEYIRSIRLFSFALSAITASVVGVIFNLSVWFVLKAIFLENEQFVRYGFNFDYPVLKSLDLYALGIVIVSFYFTVCAETKAIGNSRNLYDTWSFSKMDLCYLKDPIYQFKYISENSLSPISLISSFLSYIEDRISFFFVSNSSGVIKPLSKSPLSFPIRTAGSFGSALVWFCGCPGLVPWFIIPPIIWAIFIPIPMPIPAPIATTTLALVFCCCLSDIEHLFLLVFIT